MLLWLAIPSRWHRLDPEAKTLITAFGIGMAGYILMIGKLPNWHSFGWGPRYLVPVLPILFFPVALLLADMWRSSRHWLVPLVLISFLIGAAPVLVNWQLASALSPEEGRPWIARPVQQVAVWAALWSGLNGEQLAEPITTKTIARDPLVHQFPDLLLARIGERSRAGLAISMVSALCGCALVGMLLRRLLLAEENPSDTKALIG